MAPRTRREFLARAAATGVAATVAGAIPVARELALPQTALAQDLADATLQAFADTMIPGRKADRTDLGHAIHPLAIAGVDPDPGAVQADALLLYHHELTGFDALEPVFLADLATRSAAHGGDFLTLSFEDRTAVCVEAFSFDNPARVLWEAAAAIPFTAFCAAGAQPDQRAEVASGYRVMGLPGAAPNGYRRYSYRRRLGRGRTKKGYLT